MRFSVRFALVLAVLVGMMLFASSVQSAPIHEELTPRASHSLLLWEQLGLYAPVDLPLFHRPVSLLDGEPQEVQHPPDAVMLKSAWMVVPRDPVDDEPDQPTGAVPEPASLLLFAAGFAAVGLRTRRS